uniref:B box-type domain-containing protein n=1 Tax=Oryza meridionalis TaxID=40149 RepID=A0A0E0E4S5_9ORYZ
MGGEAERCALCGAAAAVHCEADAAFLCAACDAKVHGANFLASRHHRRRVAPGAEVAVAVVEDEMGYESGASSTSCVSTADSDVAASAAARRGRRRRPRAAARPRAEVVLEGWGKRMGLAAGAARRRAAAAGRALRACGGDVAAARVPLRVAMAAALWWEVAAHRVSGQADALRRLEACAHVPARLLTAVASSMARARARRRAAVDNEEGWDECSCSEAPNTLGDPHVNDTARQK